MDNSKKLFEGLLKADSIDPSGVSEAERAVFREMLESEKKRMKHLSWLSVGAMWIFAVAMIGLCLYEKIFEALRIPFVVGCFVIMAAMLIVMIRYMPGHNRRLRESGRKIRKLYYLVHGKHRGIPLVGKKDGKRFIYWPRIIMFTAGLWLVMSLGGAGVYYLLCQHWIYSSLPWLHIIYCTLPCLLLVIFVLRDGLKTPLEELVEVKAKSKQSKPGSRPDIWRITMKSRITKLAAAAAVIVAAVLFVPYYFAGRGKIATDPKSQIAAVLRQHGVTSPKELLNSAGSSLGLWSTAHWVAYSDVIVRARLLEIGEFSKWEVTKVLYGNVPSKVINVVNPAPEEETGWIAGIKPVGAERILFLLGDSEPYLPRGIEHGSRYPRELDDVGNEILEVIKSGKYLEVPGDGNSDPRL